MGLGDTLGALTERAKADAEFEAGKPALIKRWQDDVQALATQITEWLGDHIRSGSVSVTPAWKDVNEEMLGFYSARRLTIAAGPKRVEVVPVGRMIIGAMGAVEMFTPPVSRQDNTAVFRRYEEDGKTTWQIAGIHHPNRAMRDVSPLTRETFEAALDALLKMR